ncbi:NADH dehydrogenase (ubiquinone) 1 beta subcomplex 9 [Blastomyces dermatitidis ER-3]|uniref:NADH dehydrogenase [ubiquinone] 1 beta subcomplex subunit 9 n=3 Tax=Blastomyces TaxID=229219 RepID=A0A179UPX0_BLAGS|nr:NADH dehydrogenase (ubiquinone) 1 beta subcomplex 9 [Blastomyces gilchristii SLH14081]XP_045277910.1 NADH dehydrogenase (ubiquinone) 1 beta subcomplex 9 [Blastomyces dermatitidis ER-3]EGE80246.1 NADH dehydrogenase (ubiquinone) 1 beta subcomplex 9 [Blastomyces dermatitidis ATCC 18188]EQL28518.1 NADH dehydrogenase (ubiquinone) 1 beta subcomplex 9 [Blastomyces dermatitidis ATCC 26199]EEQ91365.2 NADH dehydrogenase (ubiquinone) 1 beta subcomplex 9 [Blastomyces dermatitidis ER-3]OAT09249.1 NADH d
MTPNPTALSLYRRSLKLALDWAVHRHLWRGQAVYIRSLFDANRDVREPRQQKILFRETEKLLDEWKHPDPYRAPSAPGGSKYERNMETPILELGKAQHEVMEEEEQRNRETARINQARAQRQKEDEQEAIRFENAQNGR